jgi:hypothetical protein
LDWLSYLDDNSRQYRTEQYIMNTLMTMEEMESALDADIAAIGVDGYKIMIHWGRATPLFNHVTRDPNATEIVDGKEVGCLTQIRHSIDRVCPWLDLTEEIRQDDRIPNGYGGEGITPEHFPVFKEWQLKIHARRLAEADLQKPRYNSR